MSAGITAGARGASAGLGQAKAGNARWQPRPRKPGLKSKSRGLETSVRAAVERRKASAPEAGGSCKRIVRGARRARGADRWRHLFVWCGQFNLRLPALRLPSFYLEAKQQWLSFLLQNSGAKSAANALALPSPGGGGSRTAGARGGVRGDAGIRSALRALSPQPATLRVSTFPLQGKVKQGDSHAHALRFRFAHA
jgi:hypothetical protein